MFILCYYHQRAAYFFNPRREVLNEQLAQVVEGLEFAGLEDRTRRGGFRENLKIKRKRNYNQPDSQTANHLLKLCSYSSNLHLNFSQVKLDV